MSKEIELFCCWMGNVHEYWEGRKQWRAMLYRRGVCAQLAQEQVFHDETGSQTGPN